MDLIQLIVCDNLSRLFIHMRQTMRLFGTGDKNEGCFKMARPFGDNIARLHVRNNRLQNGLNYFCYHCQLLVDC